jgi:GT2 family glycosyltransferase
MAVSVLTLARGRRDHLTYLIGGLCRSNTPPDELIIADMGGPTIQPPETSFPISVIEMPNGHLPLAKARNAAAAAARHEILLFLDVDCIPMASLLATIRDTLKQYDALVCAEVRYLKADALRGGWNEIALRRQSLPHPARAFPAAGVRIELNAGLFWSLAFAIRRKRFNDFGGFDERFIGYGAEDTDFGFRAKDAGIDLLFIGAAGAFHQHHEVFDPPLQHFDDIVRNAQIFYDIWNIWPMQGWLAAFERLGLISFEGNRLLTLRLPTTAEKEQARSLGGEYGL